MKILMITTGILLSPLDEILIFGLIIPLVRHMLHAHKERHAYDEAT